MIWLGQELCVGCDGSFRWERPLRVVDKHERSGRFNCFEQEGIACRSTHGCRAATIETMINADRGGAGLVYAGHNLGQDRSIQYGSQSGFALRIGDDNGQVRTGRDRDSMPEPGIIESPIQGGRGDGSQAPKTRGQNRRQQTDDERL